ncbi:MAG: prolipoprotein diacylglyceryl transferase [Caulobacteraceae bacterium]|nr:prolipoprotein diacylglyceryl transferase [Caulobacteraceae bacterium]
MIFPEFDPVLIHLGPLAIRWYALAYVSGILLGWRYTVTLVRNPRIWLGSQPTASVAQIDDLVLWITLGVILGGRLGYVLFYDFKTMMADPSEIFKVWHGGMSFHGGLIGVTLALLGFAKVNKLNAVRVADLVAPVVPIGLFFGRIANFINGELWGRPTNVPWGMVFCNGRIAQMNGGNCPAGLFTRHPSQLYEAVLEGLVLFGVLRWATHKAKWLPREGAITGLFLMGYALARISLENVRQPDAQMPDFPLGLTMGMMLSAPMLLIGAFLVWRGLNKPPAPPSEASEQAPAAP